MCIELCTFPVLFIFVSISQAIACEDHLQNNFNYAGLALNSTHSLSRVFIRN